MFHRCPPSKLRGIVGGWGNKPSPSQYPPPSKLRGRAAVKLEVRYRTTPFLPIGKRGFLFFSYNCIYNIHIYWEKNYIYFISQYICIYNIQLYEKKGGVVELRSTKLALEINSIPIIYYINYVELHGGWGRRKLAPLRGASSAWLMRTPKQSSSLGILLSFSCTYASTQLAFFIYWICWS